ncbi:hypothetical protein DV452_002436 [Geotrichum candidum]|nr:hypothetical protein DV452_002436 [Geotrichum candidum]KAI8135590.1 hypothetical protein DUD61_000805 [Geotrichum candidum]KAI9213363.1 hypothetical protein DS838_001775 [Geotrichum bryndzae]
MDNNDEDEYLYGSEPASKKQKTEEVPVEPEKKESEQDEESEYEDDSDDESPWRKPGADITDYFNYGFDEVTWSAYCSKQDKLSDFTPQKVMSMLGMGAMEMAMMGAPPMMPGMPAFPGMPGFPPPSQPGMNNNMFGGPPPPGFDGGAYGGSNVQGVAGMIANPHPGGFNGPNNTNNGSGGFNNNGGNRNFQPRNNFQQNSNNNNNNNNWNRNRR